MLQIDHPQGRLRRGFTLIELLLVIAIMAVLAGIIYVALNPTKQLALARDTERKNAISTILNAVYQYQIDSNNLPPGIPTAAPLGICKTGAASCVNGVDLSVLTLNGKYLVSIPADPQASPTGTGTNYTIFLTSARRLTVAAPGAEQSTLTETR